MNRTNLKKNLTRLLVIVTTIFVLYSIYVQLEYRHYINQTVERNHRYLSIISDIGKNLANRLEQFVELSMKQGEIQEVDSDLFNNWRIVNGESKNIYSYLSMTRTLHMGSDKPDWDLLQYSLLRIDSFIYEMTIQFLEHHSYAVSSENNEKMEAVISIYRILFEELEHEPVDLKHILQSIKEPMLIVDENYQNTLEQLGR